MTFPPLAVTGDGDASCVFKTACASAGIRLGTLGAISQIQLALANLLTAEIPVSALSIESGVLADQGRSLLVTGTLASTAASDQYGIYFNMTSAGAGTGAQYAVRSELLSGYTGTGATYGLRSVNNAEGSGNNLDHGNFGLDGISHGTGYETSATYNVGVSGQARWGASANVGVRGIGTNTNGVNTRLAQTSVGMYGKGDSDATGHQIGGIFAVGSVDPSFGTNAALIADNMDTSDPVFLGRVNGVAKMTLGATGILTLAALAGVGTRAVVVDANGVLSAP